MSQRHRRAVPNAPHVRAAREALSHYDLVDEQNVYVRTPPELVLSGGAVERMVAAARLADRVIGRDVQRLGRGNFGEAFLVQTQGCPVVVKVSARDDIHGRPWARAAQVENFMHEAGVASELRDLGFTVLPDTTYVELESGWPALVREYGEPAGRLTGEEYDELEQALFAIEGEGWRVRDTLDPYRRPNGTMFIGDVGIWQAPVEGRSELPESDLDWLLESMAHAHGVRLTVSLPRLMREVRVIETDTEMVRDGERPFLMQRAMKALRWSIADRRAAGAYVPERAVRALEDADEVLAAVAVGQRPPPPRSGPTA